MTPTRIFKEHYVNNGSNMSINTTVNGIILFRVMAKWKITLTTNSLKSIQCYQYDYKFVCTKAVMNELRGYDNNFVR